MTHHEPLVEELEFSKSACCFLMPLIHKKTWASLVNPLASSSVCHHQSRFLQSLGHLGGLPPDTHPSPFGMQSWVDSELLFKMFNYTDGLECKNWILPFKSQELRESSRPGVAGKKRKWRKNIMPNSHRWGPAWGGGLASLCHTTGLNHGAGPERKCQLQTLPPHLTAHQILRPHT